MISFWSPTHPNAYLGQWHESDFALTSDIVEQGLPDAIRNLKLYQERKETLCKVCGEFTTAEKFMMVMKAAIFADEESLAKMRATHDPKTLKALGRGVANFDHATWQRYSLDIVIVGNYLKFTQNAQLRAELIKTGDKILVEGSPVEYTDALFCSFASTHTHSQKHTTAAQYGAWV